MDAVHTFYHSTAKAVGFAGRGTWNRRQQHKVVLKCYTIETLLVRPSIEVHWVVYMGNSINQGT